MFGMWKIDRDVRCDFFFGGVNTWGVRGHKKGGEVRDGKRERRKETHDHSNVLRGAWLNAACGLRRARLSPVRVVCGILLRG